MSTDQRRFFLVTEDDHNCFEEVNWYVWDNFRNVIVPNGRRYAEAGFCTMEGGYSFFGVFSPIAMSRILRIFNLNQTTVNGNGYCRKPDSVVMKGRKEVYLYDLTTETKWKKVK